MGFEKGAHCQTATLENQTSQILALVFAFMIPEFMRYDGSHNIQRQIVTSEVKHCHKSFSVLQEKFRNPVSLMNEINCEACIFHLSLAHCQCPIRRGKVFMKILFVTLCP